MNELNLLLGHQVIKRTESLNFHHSMNTPQETSCEEEYSRSSVSPGSATAGGSFSETRCEKLKIELANVQLEESSALEQHKKLFESYCLLESLIDHVLSHLDCIILEIKSAGRLSAWLNTFSVHEQCINGQISTSLKQLNENYDLSTLEKFKGKLLMILSDNNSNVKKLYNEFQERQSNYKLALKNFKIILEILNVNEDSLKKLKQQFDEVLINYQHCRCILDRELPFAIAERSQVLADCLTLLGIEYDVLAGRRNSLCSLFKGIGQKLHENEYILVKKEEITPRSCDNE